MKEWHRTIILVALIAIAIAYIVYLRTGYQGQLENLLR